MNDAAERGGAALAPGRTHVVLVHGLFSGAEVWKQFRTLLADDPELDVDVETFSYSSPLVEARPDRRIPEPDDIADRLGTFLADRYPPGDRVVLVGHSQGGLFIQRYLSRTLNGGRGATLHQLAVAVLYACPNNGSTFAAGPRRLLIRNHAQEKQLRVFNRQVMETKRHVQRAVLNAREAGDHEYPMRIYCYGGDRDLVVPARVARDLSEDGGVVLGDHFSVVQPMDHRSDSYRVLKDRLLEVGARAVPAAMPDAAAPAGATGRLTQTPPAQSRLQGPERHETVRRVLSPAVGASRLHVLTGIGGSGKTRVAIEVARRAASARRRVWWISASRISESMREVVAELGVPEGEADAAFRGTQSSIDLVWSYLNACPDRWMLVFDNVDSPKWLGSGSGSPTSPQGTGWIRQPDTPNGSVLVTSRDLVADAWLPACEVHQVRPLSESDGAALLREGAPGAGSMEQARALSRELGGLPLALSAAAAYLRSVGTQPRLAEPTIIDFAGYLNALRERRQSPPGTGQSQIDEMFDESIMGEVCGIALALLDERGFVEAAPLLKVLACLNIAPIPYRVLFHNVDQLGSPLPPDFTAARCEATLKELAHLGLVEEVPLPGAGADFQLQTGLSLHPVVHGLLRGDADVQRDRADYYGLTVSLLWNVASTRLPDQTKNWDVWAALLPHAIEVAQLTARADVGDDAVLSRALDLARLSARYVIVNGPLRTARDLLCWLIDHCEEYGFKSDDREILALRHEKARVELEGGRPDIAERELTQLVLERKALLGPDHADTLASRHKLAKSVLEQHRWEEAEELLEGVVEAELDLHADPGHPDTITVRHSLARAQFALGRLDAVVADLRQVLQDAEQHPDSTEVVEILRIRQTLSRGLMKSRHVTESVEVIREAIRQASDRADSPTVMSLRFTYCQGLLMQGEIDRAKRETERLLTERERVLGRHHPETERTRRLLARVEVMRDIPGSPEFSDLDDPPEID